MDYWALVIKELLKKIEDEKLVGLIATPPLFAGEEELENFLRNWKEYVGGGDLIYTRSDLGRELLLKLRSYTPSLFKFRFYFL